MKTVRIFPSGDWLLSIGWSWWRLFERWPNKIALVLVGRSCSGVRHRHLIFLVDASVNFWIGKLTDCLLTERRIEILIRSWTNCVCNRLTQTRKLQPNISLALGYETLVKKSQHRTEQSTFSQNRITPTKPKWRWSIETLFAFKIIFVVHIVSIISNAPSLMNKHVMWSYLVAGKIEWKALDHIRS